MVYLKRTSFETPSARNVHAYYQHFQNSNIRDITIDDREELNGLMDENRRNAYIACTFDTGLKEFPELEKNGNAVLASSSILYQVNCWLARNHMDVIPEIWVVYKLEKVTAIREQ